MWAVGSSTTCPSSTRRRSRTRPRSRTPTRRRPRTGRASPVRFSGEGLSDELGHGLTDSLASEPSALPEPGHELELDDVDLAELETGDGLGELEVLVGLTDLPGNARCLAAA